MRRVSEIIGGGSDVAAAARLGINRERAGRGERVLARDHLPFNRRDRKFGAQEIERVCAAAASQGIDRQLQYRLRAVLWDVRTEPDEERKEQFMLLFNEAFDRAQDLIFEQLEVGARAAFQVYVNICKGCPRLSAESEIRRATLAQRCRLSIDQVSRQTAALARIGLLRVDQDGRGVRYVVLPVEDLGLPLWHGDKAARRDAANEARDRLAAERQPELV